MWKVCDWEQVFRDYESPREGDSIKVSDLLLSQAVTVIEPLWKIILSSPALMAVMWELFPDHALLLRAEWNAEGYFSDKPSDKRSYGFSFDGQEKPCVYTEVFETEQFGEYSPVVHAWPLMRMLSGFTLVDRNHPHGFPFICCRVVGDD